MTISLGVKKVENLLQGDKAMAKKVEIMERNLMEKSKKKYFITIAHFREWGGGKLRSLKKKEPSNLKGY